ncbi:MAG TPA: c-type cytochrome, partial [Planctomycetota bacterium]|nr:c-type cytochrome [Planctomycetota bacterium]
MSRLATIVSIILLACCDDPPPEDAKSSAPDPSPYQEAYARLGGTPDRSARGCASCHQGMNDLSMIVLPWGTDRTFRNPDLLAAAERAFPDPAVRRSMTVALMAHPKPDVIAGPHSPHASFSCQKCHVYDDRQSEPTLTEDRRKYWLEHHMKVHPGLKDVPLRLSHRQQAMCLRCHMGEEPLPGAETINRGRGLYMATACHTCHVTDGMKILEADLQPGEKTVRRPGPPLTPISGKVDKRWMYNWVSYPPAFKPTARMPPIFPRGAIVGKLPPQIAPQDLSKERIAGFEEVLIASVVEYVFSISAPLELDEIPDGLFEKEDWKVDDQRARGRTLVEDRGCLGCHRIDDDYSPNYKQEEVYLESEFATNLLGSGDKFDSPLGRRWLFTWLRNPRHYNPETPMPEFGLAEKERADIVQFLLSLKVDNDSRRRKGWKTWEPKDPPVRIDGDRVEITSEGAKVLDELIAYQKGPTDAPLKEKVLWEGRKVVEAFTCYSCHRLGGEWDAKPVVWGVLSHDLLPPRQIMSRMPLFELSAEESNLMVTYLWGAIEGTKPPADRHSTSPRRKALAAGERVLEKYNCQGCHTLEMVKLYVRDGDRIRGGEVNFKGRVERSEELDRPHWAVDWLRRPADFKPPELSGKYPALVPSYLVERFDPARGGSYAFRRMPLFGEEDRALALFKMPPPLRTVGRKLDPNWMKEFLKNPERLSATRSSVMPKFALEPDEIEALVEYFRVRDGAVPEDSRAKIPDSQIDARFPDLLKADRLLQAGCAQCHAVDGVGNEYSVDLGLVHRRLQRPWLKEFLRDPGSFYAATPMPSLPADASVDDVADLLLNYDRFRWAKIRLGGVREILEALRSPDPDAEALVEAAISRMALNPSLSEAVAPTMALALTRKMNVAGAVSKLLSHSDGAVRRVAVETLVRMGARDRADEIARRLKDPEAAVRGAAILAIAQFREERFAGEVARLLEDPEAAVRATAIRGAGTLSGKGVVSIIARRLEDVDDEVRRVAVEEIAWLEGADHAAAIALLLRTGPISLRV